MDQQLIIPIVAAIAVLLAVVLLVVFTRKRKALPRAPVAEAPAPKAEVKVKAEVPPPPAPDLSARLTRTRGSLFGRLSKFFAHAPGDAVPPAEWDEIEETLLEGDVGMTTSTLLLDRVKGRLKNGGNQKALRDLFREESEGLLAGLAHGVPDLGAAPKPYVISIVGVNGVGKTTTIGKLADHFKSQGKVVLMGAGDTFRAAAIDQLRIWADRTGSQFVAGKEGGDPGAVAFDAVTAAKARAVDVALLDTAGRLHTKTNLMEELKKVHRVIKKVIPEAPHETWLVLDGTLGQNSISQAREFGKTLELTGVIVTKLDGTAKGGAVLAIAAELKLPIRFIGVGEAVGDLIPFDPKPFVGAILGQ